MGKEIRCAGTEFEVRAGADVTQPPVIRGYAAVIGSVSEDMGFREIIEPGAFDGVLGDDVRALWNHNSEKVLGRTASGTLKIWADERGLGYEATPPDAQWARDVLESIRRGDVDQSSFGFDVGEEGQYWERLEDGTALRHITRFTRLYDVSPVTFPAYAQTTVEARAMAEAILSGGVQEYHGAADAEQTQARLDLQRLTVEIAEHEI